MCSREDRLKAYIANEEIVSGLLWFFKVFSVVHEAVCSSTGSTDRLISGLKMHYVLVFRVIMIN